ncbi:hypothetical protein BJP34_35435 [Moorena producens PAL-8-15-08-1]|uniref:Isopentenyl pyrophosphate isomerase n=1 Tax=Moorena producens PAL-8-15-08-1 TaxID=1458985 RepID=A0A1D8U2A9_9CYAN|nr:hypothetical protein BJP34_35435 [Moorena producens PAL-8-15-08-1]
MGVGSRESGVGKEREVWEVWGDGEMGRWGDGEMGRWGNGEMGRWGNGEMRRWRDGESDENLHQDNEKKSI